MGWVIFFVLLFLVFGTILRWGWNFIAWTHKRAGQKKCPFCAEEIKAESIVCRYCGRDI
jgi:hypothetical protein